MEDAIETSVNNYKGASYGQVSSKLHLYFDILVQNKRAVETPVKVGSF
jgi:hypothetical protein